VPDPLTLALLGAAATEGVKFLYGQATAVLAEWRQRRRSEAATPPAEMSVPIIDAEVLDGRPAGSIVDTAVLERHEKSLVRLQGALSPYAQGLADVEPTDDELAKRAGELRELLEAAYGQRFTFRGENREATGTRVTVRQVLGDVEGAAVAAEADVGPGAQLEVDQQAGVIKDGGTIHGFKGRIGK
jgi:hypothetical protein